MDLFLKRKITLILGSEFTIKYQLEPFGYKVGGVIKLQELPLPKLVSNYIAFNKSVPEHVIKQFYEEYKKLKMKDDFVAHKHTYLQ
jgi:polar amino acid transport system substrate-binding protein